MGLGKASMLRAVVCAIGREPFTPAAAAGQYSHRCPVATLSQSPALALQNRNEFMRIQIARGVLSGCLTVGILVFLAGIPGLPDSTVVVFTGGVLMVAGYAGFRWVSGKHPDAAAKKGRPSGAVRAAGLLFVILGVVLLFGGAFKLLATGLLLAAGGIHHDGLMILLKLFAIGIVPGALLVAAGVGLRKAHGAENTNGAADANAPGSDAIERARSRGDDVYVDIPASEAAVARLERRIGTPLPGDVRAYLLKFGCVSIGDVGISGIVGNDPLLPEGSNILHDTARLRAAEPALPASHWVISPHEEGAYCLDLSADGAPAVVNFEHGHSTKVSASFSDFVANYLPRLDT